MKRTLFYLRTHQKQLLQIAVSLFFVGLGIYFLRHERAEVRNIKEVLLKAHQGWVLSGVALLGLFVAVQGWMYVYSFAAIGQRIGLGNATGLYLKRNLISVFLPAGLLTNLFFFNEELERKEGVTQTQSYLASSIFSICSILSSVIIGLPALLWLFLRSRLSVGMIWGVLSVAAFLIILFLGIRSFLHKGTVYRLLARKAPAFIQITDQLESHAFNSKAFYTVVALSCLIEIIGIAHLYISIEALGGHATLAQAAIGYAVVLVLLMSSPFLRGLGAIEVALSFTLTQFGFSTIEAASIALLFRFFEFWSLMILGALLIVVQRGALLVRVFPALLLFVLGLVNILSAVTPAVPERLRLLKEYLPLTAIHASTYFILFSGILMLGIGAYLMRGLRNAWWMAVALSGLSLAMHLTKGIDYEEALLACVVLASLLYERKQYFIRNDPKLVRLSWFPGLVIIGSVLLFGTIGYYLMDEQHFSADFTVWQSFRASVSTFLLLKVDLVPVTRFGKEFFYGMNFLGGATLAYLGFLLLRPLAYHAEAEIDDRVKAAELIEKYGRSGIDYFKTYRDKSYWFGEDGEGFVAFKTSRSYAVALELPVGKDEETAARLVTGFERWCRRNGLRTAWYRVPESNLRIFEQLGKKALAIGEDASINLDAFTLQGGDNRSLRNVVNRLTKEGYTFHTYDPPHRDNFLQQLRAVSDEWLQDNDRHELSFSQGTFEEPELKNQPVFTIENQEGKILGFVNIIPSYAPGEANFDLMRKTTDSPNGTMDFLFINLFEKLKSQGFRRCNFGMVPMSGIDSPGNVQERIIKLAYERMRQFSHYKNLRFYKEKFHPEWQMMYLVYNAPFDLVYLPGALEKIMQPDEE
ncbi:MAG: lysylphosphatidylglycerol synthetase family protein [Lewinellaceae bacterium]|nr:lysylphosphatidylglycerol synthetase family protein [Lewinellaceae bacterium]